SPWGAGIDSMFQAGVLTQAWGLALYPLALGRGRRFLDDGRGLLPGVALAILCGLCHPLIALALLVPLALRRWSPAGARRALLLGGLALLGAAPFWLPILVYYDSFGGFARTPHETGIPVGELGRMLLRGDLLDFGRWPLL